MPQLLLGPVLRYVGRTEATVWVETDRPCRVAVLGRDAPTFTIAGHHYALVRIDGLAPDATHPYRVELDGEAVWPEPGSADPPSVIRTQGGDRPVRVVFGSCRLARPHTPPYTLAPDEHDEGRGVDALTALAEHLAGAGREELPDLVLHLGDQVYSDEPPGPVLDFLRGRRGAVPGPADEVVDFEEFARLYADAWSEPRMRWLLSTVPNVMMFDDHDVHDDWNTSAAWRRERARVPWWRGRMEAALASLWVYQHLGNLDLADCAAEGVLDLLERRRGDAWPLLREHLEAGVGPGGIRWSCRRDLGCARLVAIDSRTARVLGPGRRDMIGPREWEWVDAQLRGDVDHLLVASSLPVLLPPGLHDLEAWNERLCDGAWGARIADLGEQLRRDYDLEHWAAFGAGLDHLLTSLLAVARGQRGRRPATISLLGGDVHFGYVAEAAVPPGAAPIAQIVGSPMRNRLQPRLTAMVRAGLSPGPRAVTRALAALAGARRPPLRWRIAYGPWFENHVVDLRLGPGRAGVAVREARPGSHPELRTRLLLHTG